MCYNVFDPWGLCDLSSYCLGSLRRSGILLNTLRQRGDAYFKHLENGQPPVLFDSFAIEEVMDGRTFVRPVNYALVKIIDRRKQDRRENDGGDERVFPVSENRQEDRRMGKENAVESQRVFVIIDPRAGHGPGIGGSKELSQIGLALDYGYEVYFVMFFPEPVPHQKVADVEAAEIIFLEEVARRHPGTKPSVIGNCQAGWAIVLLAADRPELVNGISLNGSPLSYWGGGNTSHPMRNNGTLLGGVWLASFLSDLGNGRFDGSRIVSGFESLNPANTWWTKLYGLYCGDNSPERYLEFEKWWNGFFYMSEEEIHFIAQELFIGNKLERGELRLDGRLIDLKNLKNMVIQILCSYGDNITPPPQALAWLLKVFGTDEEIIKRKLIIIFSIDPDVGHLGIFVGKKVCDRHHRESIGGTEALENLSPGIYEAITKDTPGKPSEIVYAEGNPGEILYGFGIVKSSLSRIQEICGPTDELFFAKAAEMSEKADASYCTFIRPWIKPWITEGMAKFGQESSFPRLQHQFLSSRNPWMQLVKFWAPWFSCLPKIEKDNPLLSMEQATAKVIQATIGLYGENRDSIVAQLQALKN